MFFPLASVCISKCSPKLNAQSFTLAFGNRSECALSFCFLQPKESRACMSCIVSCLSPDSSKDGSGLSQDSVYSVHMADAGTDSNEREKAYHLYNRQTNYHKNLLQALQRIEDGTFGVCVISGELIPEERMLEVPNATKRVEHKEAEKLNIPKK